jgi:hypothetical protein
MERLVKYEYSMKLNQKNNTINVQRFLYEEERNIRERQYVCETIRMLYHCEYKRLMKSTI